MKYLFLILMIMPVAEGLLINEIMYDPEGDDNDREYIEILHDKNLSLENFTVKDAASSDILKLVRSEESNFSLIVEDGFNHSNINASIYSAGSSIGNGLGNSQESILIISQSGTIMDNVSYSSITGGINGKALCRVDSVFAECEPTPGRVNGKDEGNTTTNITINESAGNHTPSENNTNNTNYINYTLEITEIMANPIGDDRAAYPDGEWIEVLNYGDFEINLENLRIEDEKNNNVKIKQTNFADNSIIKSKSYKVVYLNGWSIFNNDGDSVVLSGENIIDRVNYSSIEQGFTWSKIDNIWRRTNPTPGEANKYEENRDEPYVKIKKVYKDEATFGDVVKIKAELYKGNSNKNEVRAYIEKVSEETSLNVFSKFTNLTLVLPIQTKTNCDKKIASGRHTITLEGFDREDKSEIEIKENGKCRNEKEEKQEKIKTKKASSKVSLEESKKKSSKNTFYEKKPFESLINQSKPVVVYESPSIKAKNYAIYIFGFLMIVLNLYLVIKKENGED
ncbi:MAG: lamin tail domain-containing protein [Nanoarchaeota archaeon]